MNVRFGSFAIEQATEYLEQRIVAAFERGRARSLGSGEIAVDIGPRLDALVRQEAGGLVVLEVKQRPLSEPKSHEDNA